METLFVKYLGDSPKIRVLDMLITGRELDYSITDIAEQAGIGRSTFYRMIEDLLESKVIIPTRKLGNMQLFRLNTNHLLVKELIRFYDNIAKNYSEKGVKRQKLVVI